MDELLYQAEDIMTLNPGLSDREIAHRLASWLLEAAPERDVLIEFVSVMRRTPYFHQTSFVLH